MAFVQNFPFFSVILAMAAAIFASVLPAKWARGTVLSAIAAIGAMNAMVLGFVLKTGRSYVYYMGRFPAPWGNELRVGPLEALMALAFCVVMLLSLTGGLHRIQAQVESGRQSLYFIMSALLLASLIALVYTNDLFTAYVFVEINTLSACGLIMSRQNGRHLVAAVRYMVMSLLGSGLLLIGITMIYDLTGHLLMSNIRTAIAELAKTGMYDTPLTVTIGVISVGLAIKSALVPFHSWLSDAYSYSTPSSSAMLSSLASKGYIFLLIKIYWRVIGLDVIVSHKITGLLFLFGFAGVFIGSISAIRQNSIRRMTAYSSVAQIGFIYMAIGLGTHDAFVAAVFHMLVHAAAKSMLFISGSALSEVSGNSYRFRDLRGAGYRCPVAGLAFMVGAMSMVGIPLFGGFISKIYVASAAFSMPLGWMLPALIAIAASTLLNTVYFLRTVMTIYRPELGRERVPVCRTCTAALVLFICLNMLLGVLSEPVVRVVERGLYMFV